MPVRLDEPRTLTRFAIGEEEPGTILRDFAALLDFIGTEGLRSTGKHHLLPLARLAELDERMQRPLRPPLARPQQRSFPYLHGLYLLLRATELAVPQDSGRTAGRLMRQEEMFAQWQSLNPTERYFNLLEAWLLVADWEMAGEHRRPAYGELPWIWKALCGSKDFSGSVKNLFYSIERQATLALLEGFGGVEIDRAPPKPGDAWRIRRIRRTPLGMQMVPWILENLFKSLRNEDGPEGRLGVWQRELQPLFPEWRNNLAFPEAEFRGGVHIFKVSLGDVWRRIAMPAESDLEELAWMILRAFKFDGDHLYGFEMANRDGSTLHVAGDTGGDSDLLTSEMLVGYVPTPVGGSFRFDYDYGASWRFKVVLQEIDPKSKLRKPKVVESKGKPPREYEDDGW